MKAWTIAAAAAALAFRAVPSAAQLETPASPCGGQPEETRCPAAFQALASAAPQIGIVAAAGSPVPGVEGTRGLSLGIIPKTTLSLRVSAARVHLPDLGDPQAERSLTPFAVKLATATRVYEGNAAGTGAFELLLEGGVLAGTGDGGRTAAVLGAGARLGLLRETFATPGVALSGTFHHTGPVHYGKTCTALPGCGVGVNGSADFGVDDISARLTVGKRLGPVGVMGGAGWDRFSTTNGFITYRGSGGFEPVSGTAAASAHDSRWSAFVNLSKGLLVGSVVAEAGWMSGGDAVDQYTPATAGYDPGQGTFFGSIALRVQL